MAERHGDWIRQARRDLEHAREALADGIFEWSCFAAQQAAEKAVKAVFQRFHAEAWGHSVTGLLQKLPAPVKVPGPLLQKAKELDKHYLPTRYPNGFDQGAPMDYYTKSEARRAVAHAESLIEFCESLLRE